MSEDRENTPARAAETPETPVNPGAPVEETEASHTEVLEAVGRATAETAAEGAGNTSPVAADAASTAVGAAADQAAGTHEGEGAQPFAGGSAAAEPVAAGNAAAADDQAAEQARREAISKIETQLDLDPVPGPRRKGPAPVVTSVEELPSAGPDPLEDSPVRDGEIRISADHPMAALYMQTPLPPDLKGNRGAGVLISLLATVGYAVVSAGALALWLAPQFPPSQFVDAFLPWLLSWGFIASTVAFFVGLVLLVLIVGKAGWWAYVLGGFLVAVLVWAAAVVGYAVHFHELARGTSEAKVFSWDLLQLVGDYGLLVPTIIAGLVAREATIWFGAWIGSRGRRVRARNAAAIADYEVAVAEAQAKQP